MCFPPPARRIFPAFFCLQALSLILLIFIFSVAYGASPPPVTPVVGVMLLGDDIQSVQPDNGPLAGGNVVVLTGNNITNGQPGDIERVELNGVPVAEVFTSPDQNQVTVTAGAAATAGRGHVVVTSRSRGISRKSFGYTYNPGGRIDEWSITGEYVLISGDNLGNGEDITSVHLLKVAADILLQSATAVFVRVGTGTSGNSGAIEIESVSHGLTFASGFTYPPAAPGAATLSSTAAGYPSCEEAGLSSITPSLLSAEGGELVLLTGDNIAGTLSAASLAGIPAEIIQQTDGAVVLRSGATGLPRTGNAAATLNGCGTLILENAVQYGSD